MKGKEPAKEKRKSRKEEIETGMSVQLEAPDGGLARTLKDLFAGAVGGVAQVLLGTLC